MTPLSGSPSPTAWGRGQGGEGISGDSTDLAFTRPTEELIQLARQNRRNATNAEQLLWSLLRRRQVHGTTFRRQHPLGRFIADFYCDAARLVVEIDGIYHEEPTQQERDINRESIIRANRLSVLRFTNQQVLQDTEEAIRSIANFVAANDHRSRPHQPVTNGISVTPLPPQRGGGGRGERAASRTTIGVHLLLDLYEVAPERLTDADLLGGAITEAACAAGMTPLSAPVLHRFPGGGLTGFLLLAESHIAFHSYPERGYLAADVFTCGPDPDGPDRAVAALLAAVQPGRPSIRRFDRGAEFEEQ